MNDRKLVAICLCLMMTMSVLAAVPNANSQEETPEPDETTSYQESGVNETNESFAPIVEGAENQSGETKEQSEEAKVSTQPISGNSSEEMMPSTVQFSGYSESTVNGTSNSTSGGVQPDYAGSTHSYYFDNARSILYNDNYKGNGRAIANFIASWLNTIKQGSDYADNSNANHYMYPYNHAGLPLSAAAGTECLNKFNQAVQYWNNGDTSNAMYYLGWAAHLVQDACVPQHAGLAPLFGHSEYETWVYNNCYSYPISSGGTYSFSTVPSYQPVHSSQDAFGWVDYNAYESLKYFGLVDNDNTGEHTEGSDRFILETTHNLPNSVDNTYVVTFYGASQIKLHFSNFNMENGFDTVQIIDGYDNVIHSWTGTGSNFWTNYISGNTIKIRIKTDSSVNSWGFKIDTAVWYDNSGNQYSATVPLMERAQRTSAGFIYYFFKAVDMAPSVSLTSPNGGEIWSGYETVTWRGMDPDGDYVTYDIDLSSDGGSTWKDVKTISYTESGSWSTHTYSFDTWSYADGRDCRIRILADDGKDRTAMDISDYGFILDNTAPDTSIEIPQSGGVYVNGRQITSTTTGYTVIVGDLTMRAYAYDISSGVSRVTFTMSGTIGSRSYTDYSYPYQWNWQPGATDAGLYTLTVRAYDNAGNYATRTLNNIIVIPAT